MALAWFLQLTRSLPSPSNHIFTAPLFRSLLFVPSFRLLCFLHPLSALSLSFCRSLVFVLCSIVWFRRLLCPPSCRGRPRTLARTWCFHRLGETPCPCPVGGVWSGPLGLLVHPVDSLVWPPPRVPGRTVSFCKPSGFTSLLLFLSFLPLSPLPLLPFLFHQGLGGSQSLGVQTL